MTDQQKERAEDLTLLRFLNVVLQRRYAIARGALLVAVLGLAAALLWPRSFESTGAFIPQSQGLPSGLGTSSGRKRLFPSGLPGPETISPRSRKT